MGLFGKEKKENPKEMVNQWTHNLRKEGYNIDRQIRGIQREEEKVKRSLKESAKKGEKESCKILAKEIVRSRKAVNRLYTSKAHMNSVQMQMKNQLATLRIAGALEKSTEVMKSMQALIKIPEIQATMREMSKEMMKAQNLNEDAEIILPPPSQFQDSPETLNTEPSCQSGAHTMTFEMSTQTNYGLVKRRHVSIQTEIRPSTISTGTQTETMFSLDAPEDLDESFESLASTDSAASEWIPPDLDENNNIDHHHVPPSHCRRKFIVFEECLDQLLQICTICGQKCDIKKTIVGTLLFVSRVCVCGETFTWGSQPFTGSIPTGNLVLSAAILISGSSINQSLTMFQHANISCFSERTYHNIQQHYLVPAVERVWKVHQDAIFDVIRQQNVAVVVGGDARCCSPGHTAKYGSYSLMDLELRQILDVQLVQSNEVKSSYWMEMEGLTRCLKRVEEEGVVISDLVTDRHPQIKAYMKKERSDINHWFDVWHMAKGVFKKLEAIGKKKKYKQVGDWARSVSNHLYWCAASSEGDGELVSEKWLSILNHITDVHEGHGKRFPKCLHGDLEDRDWIKKGSLAFQEMEKVVKGRLLVQDIKKLSPAEQTSALEAYHNVVCHFAPKSLHFFYASMKARLYIAALHFNENSSRDQAVNKSGELIYSVSYPKGRNGAGIPKEVKAGILEEMLEDTMETLDDDELEEEADSEVEKVLYELTAGELGKAPAAVADTLPVPEPEGATAMSDEEDEDLTSRLEALRS